MPRARRLVRSWRPGRRTQEAGSRQARSWAATTTPPTTRPAHSGSPRAATASPLACHSSAPHPGEPPTGGPALTRGRIRDPHPRKNSRMTLGPEAVDAAAIEHEVEAPSAPLAPAATRRGVRALSAYAVPLVLALATFAVFAPALWNQFVDWDDQMILTQNENYRGLGPTQLKYFFTTFLMGHYVPLTWLTFGLDYVLWGMNPMGYHLTSLIIYAANAVVLYFVTLRLLGKAAALADVPLRVGAVAATLFFTLHPLRAESVAWATERRDVLSGLFFLLTILAYVKMCDATGARR